jgi:hypothetical protein
METPKFDSVVSNGACQSMGRSPGKDEIPENISGKAVVDIRNSLKMIIELTVAGRLIPRSEPERQVHESASVLRY